MLYPVLSQDPTRQRKLPYNTIAIIDQLSEHIVAKRRLNKQQTMRIKRRQSAITDESRQTVDDSRLSEERKGQVISHYRSQADVECAATGDVVRCHLRANLPTLVTGDNVTWRRGLEEQAETGIVEAIDTRTSELCRPDSYGKMKLVSANITRAIIVIAPEPEPHSNLIDRYLVVAEHLGLETLLVLNKCDLVSNPEKMAVLQKKYAALGYPTLPVSSQTGEGMAALRQAVNAGCSVFVGQSGVGKSSIIQALLPSEEIKIGELSDVARKGRHTTTHARLYHFPEGGDCIDSPGIREFGLWHLTEDDVLHGFKEFRPLIGQCKFRNCTHINDKFCAIKHAVEQGELSQARYDSFTYIIQSLGDVTIQGA